MGHLVSTSEKAGSRWKVPLKTATCLLEFLSVTGLKTRCDMQALNWLIDSLSQLGRTYPGRSAAVTSSLLRPRTEMAGIGHFAPNQRDREFEFTPLRQAVFKVAHSPENSPKFSHVSVKAREQLGLMSTNMVE